VVTAIRNGSVDVLEKPVAANILLIAVEAAVRQSREARRELAEWVRATGLIGALTRRERQVMEFVIAGYRNKEIARWLGITEKTVKVHRARVLKKTSTASVAELVRLCTLAGIEPRVLNPMEHGEQT
jgi:FixJ family two-component response regulator